jgi:ribulose bisphosphate carboxylase small subunit
MIESGLILTGNEAELLNRALEEVKAKFYEKSETSLDDTQALDALVSCFRTAEKEEQQKETRHAYLSPLRKRLVLGTLLDRPSGAKESDSASQTSN